MWRINRLLYKLPNRPFAKTNKDNRAARLVDINFVVDEINLVLAEIEASIVPTPALESNILYVDLEYGNDATATINSPILPYATYIAARTASTSGDTIVLRTSTTSYGVVTLKDGVNIYAQPGTTAERLTDNGVAVTSVIKGALNLYSTGNDTFQVTGASNVHAELNEIYSEGSALRVKPSVGISNVYLSVVRVYGVINNGLLSVGNGANFTVDVLKDLSTGAMVESFSGVGLFTFTGRLVVNCPYIFIGNSASSAGSGLLRYNNGSSAASRVTINSDRIEEIFDHPTPNRVYGSVSMQGDGRLEINCADFSTINYPCFQTNTLHVNAVVKFIGKAYSEKVEVIRHANSGDFIFENAVLHRGSGGTDDNRVVVVGNPAGEVVVYQGQPNNNKLAFRNCIVVKTSLGTAGNDPEVIIVDGTGGDISIKDTDIIVQGTPAVASLACDAGSIAEGNIYFRNTFATEVLGVNIVPTEIVSGFIGGDTALDTLDTIH